MKVFYLIRSDFITINKKTIEIHGGNFVPPENILFNERLQYVIESVSAKVFGKEIYPDLWDKAQCICSVLLIITCFKMGIKGQD